MFAKYDQYTSENKFINIFLHESGHALIEEKHFRYYSHEQHASKEELGPYTDELDCDDTVMAYREDCRAVIN